MDYLKINEMEEGYTYYIHARNAKIGIWFGKHKSFVISRHKFGDNFLFEEYHWDIGAPFGTVRPVEKIERSPFIPTRDLVWESLKNKDGEKYMGIKREEEVLDYLNKMSRDYISISELIDRIRNKEYKCELGELSKDKDWSRLVKLIMANGLYSKIVETDE